MIRVQIPYHLRTLARVDGEVALEVPPPVTPTAILEAIEARYPMLRGAIRDHLTGQRRPYLRYFACNEDVSLAPSDRELPAAIASGLEPFMVVGAVAGG
jgi:sulfur-carrier protein